LNDPLEHHGLNIIKKNLKRINYTFPLEKSWRPKLTQDSAVWVWVSGVCDDDEEHEMSGKWILLLRERRRMELNWGRGRHVLDDVVVVVILQFDSDDKHKNCCAATTAIATMFHIFVLLQVLIVPSIIQTCHNLLKWTVRIVRYKHLKEHFYLLSEYVYSLHLQIMH
jgi:hypothetical protein